ncbi:MAG: hypothetical protein SFU98_17765 [Leptospiraceae bacterium]|nr:hypothetical protein [Leptospiraceae bacterium]
MNHDNLEEEIQKRLEDSNWDSKIATRILQKRRIEFFQKVSVALIIFSVILITSFSTEIIHINDEDSISSLLELDYVSILEE